MTISKSMVWDFSKPMTQIKKSTVLISSAFLLLITIFPALAAAQELPEDLSFSVGIGWRTGAGVYTGRF
ncbi:hypothetical protein [Rhodohalobacter mucosus]|uniref:hypothetical protein n=1 Tax=Rhodohalobacter mucosus TaxID=2079485 RepID=UPI0011B2626B|nr:hypothetical protein [Rhodohalobacter mucosus]